MATTKGADLFVSSAWLDNRIAGCILFSRLGLDQDDRTVFILSPVAVATDIQGQGIGQNLLKFGLHELRKHGVKVAVTYGDPDYYSKVGFRQITAQQAQPPLMLHLMECYHQPSWRAQMLPSVRWYFP